ncbi:uncharacterized protein LOC115447095 isoform X2 [Manduca sexta]|nr:uncharacterized protein LOC115447095 isoform X2 [Manduca sexta]XP_030029885.1 uncharacterized protein LOC115447095 isoform X2 [Manduca sexta]
MRSSYMLREAHRERQEKITALQTQLECKNLAGLMYVMCSEKRKSKLEKMRIIEDYTNYIHSLQDILTEAQSLILHLSRGYKTAARVDHDWRIKMTKLIKEFQLYVYNYGGGTPESNQYLFDLPALMKIETPVVDNPDEDPCEAEEEVEKEPSAKEEDKNWWDRLEGDTRPFIMFGDMGEFKPPQRREVLKAVKAIKTAPTKWKEYVFNEMLVKAECSNADSIKDEYPKRLGTVTKWECQAVQTSEAASRMSIMNRRMTGQSIDIRGDMGSILKIITSHGTNQPSTKATLLAARDSMEIASTTKLREKIKRSEQNKVVINVGKRRTSHFDEISEEEYDEDTTDDTTQNIDDDDFDESATALGSVHNDSLQMINSHVPDKDHKINYEKVCPLEKCQRMQVDSFMKSLPPYMRANPFTHFEQTFEEYETCSPEQLEILKRRIEESKKKERRDLDAPESDPLAEWTPSVEGIAVQTSALSMSLPPCTCNVPGPTPVSSVGKVYRMDDLIPVKMALDRINKECFYDPKIEFDRFKVIGEDSSVNLDIKDKQEFRENRVQEIQNILRQHPSLLDIFQANTRC